MSIQSISNRSNIIYKSNSIKDAVIYEDHRTILSVLYFLKEQEKLQDSFDIVMFDYHDDYLNPSPTALKKIFSFLKKPSQEKLNEIVEYHLSTLDDDWVKAGMELGLINNVFLFNSEQSSLGLRNQYDTQKFGKKFMYNIGPVWGALGFQGALNYLPDKTFQPLWNDFGWNLNNGKFQFHPNRKKYILDIDLDCFSTKILGRTIAIPEEVLQLKLTEYCPNTYHHYHSAYEFMLDLLKNSELATICFESECCGGIRESHKIFNWADGLFFENELGG
ncbi:UPF0489 family protein [Lacibacter sp.]|uniref:UPF0489 family protein n=1 Tax=Lacibacter sp. TaxID=1915409 RepID=UPI002B4ADEFA|nr:UPF0489 family protein [Lacibacter sp.]HLP37732.1 UPF0489 family protein [Lacibacter sp.]